MGSHHFHYKHPLFGRGDWLNEPQKIKETEGGVRWDHSPYNLWFECLLRSKSYRIYCETGKGKFGNVFQLFGNVFAYDGNFKKWFLEDDRGIKLFAEPYSEVTTKQLSERSSVDWANDNLCVIQFDASRYQAFVLRQVRRLVKEACVRAQAAKVLSKARVQFVSAPKDCDAYRRMLQVWDLTQRGEKTSTIHAACYPQKKRTIEQRQSEALARKRKAGSDDYIDALAAKVLLQKQMSQEVRRDYKRACRLIENAAKGFFPKTT